jgi:hypothetical protein
MDVTVRYNDSLATLCGEELLFEAADLNGIGITDALVPGVQLSLPTAAVTPAITSEFITRAEAVSNLVTVLPGQTWADMVIQQLGDEERLFELVDLNGVGITNDLVPGTTITSAKTATNKASIVKALALRKPGSLFRGIDDAAPEGIEYWAIEVDFIVSGNSEVGLDFSQMYNSQYIPLL